MCYPEVYGIALLSDGTGSNIVPSYHTLFMVHWQHCLRSSSRSKSSVFGELSFNYFHCQQSMTSLPLPSMNTVKHWLACIT